MLAPALLVSHLPEQLLLFYAAAAAPRPHKTQFGYWLQDKQRLWSNCEEKRQAL
jgi:hypothetical protein